MPNTVSYARDIRPLFTAMDIDHMQPMGVLLDDFTYMSDPGHAQDVLDQVSSGSMPPPDSGEPPWDQQRVQMFQDWINGGFQP
ncbi:hypothetical protein ABT072_33335 [Streptomyces sp. NPDC002589]|uniref:hypothetical protein n=1 Tax=Streptomyces sp. NPDC002589 TaxID=3154420 RepID=UPI00331AE85D